MSDQHKKSRPQGFSQIGSSRKASTPQARPDPKPSNEDIKEKKDSDDDDEPKDRYAHFPKSLGQQEGLSRQFKKTEAPKEKEVKAFNPLSFWICKKCNNQNHPAQDVCNLCGANRPPIDPASFALYQKQLQDQQQQQGGQQEEEPNWQRGPARNYDPDDPFADIVLVTW